MDEAIRTGVARLAGDTQSGASELVALALDILRRARTLGRPSLLGTARAVCAAQPSMAPILNAAAAALADADDPGSLDRFEQRWRRAGAALRRVAADALGVGPEPPEGKAAPPRHVTTFSFSGTVAAVLSDLGRRGPLSVACAEGRPGFEGRRLASHLAAERIPVQLTTDAAIGSVLAETEAVLLGADAVAGEWFVNKCGSGLLAAAASAAAVPVFVLATRDKFLPALLAPLLVLPDHDPAEVWPSPPAGVRVHNPYFERVPLDLVSALVTDAGLLGVEMAEEVCRSNGAGVTPEIVQDLSR